MHWNKFYFKNKSNTQAHPFLIMLLYFTIIYVLWVVYVYWWKYYIMEDFQSCQGAIAPFLPDPPSYN